MARLEASDAGAPPDALSAGAMVTGRIADSQGTPIAGARITLVRAASAASEIVTREAASGAEGRFTIEGLPPGKYRVTVRASGYLVQTTSWEAPSDLALRLVRPARVVGRVIDQQGRPVAGALLALVNEEAEAAQASGSSAAWSEAMFRLQPIGELGVLPGPIPYPPPPGTTPVGGPGARSDASGRFAITEAPPGRAIVVARHPAYAESRSPMMTLVEGGYAEAELTLAGGGVARGRVVDERGPVTGAEIWIDGALRTLSAADGHFELGQLPGRVDVEVRARGHVTTHASLEPGGEEVEIRLGSGTGGRVTGTVRDERGFPVSGARLVLRGPGGERSQTSSDARGEFVFAQTSSGPFTLEASAPPRYPVTMVRAAAGDDVRVSLAPGGGVSGTVRNGSGGPLPGDLRLSIEDAQGVRHAVELGDRQGRFTAPHLAVGRATLRAEAGGYVPVTLPLVVPAGHAAGEITLRDVQVALVQGATLHGTINDRYGVPVPGLTVQAGNSSATTDEAGRFRLGPLPVGRLTVSIASHGLWRTVTLAPGEELRLDFQLR